MVLNRNSCRIEVYGGFEGTEISYISGTLFEDIPSICSCYLHYQPIDRFSKIELNESLIIGRIVWCVLGCPKDVIQWCKNGTNRSYCQKHVILFDLFDEGLITNIEHYSDFAAVYRNYLRTDSGNHVTYLTNDLRKLLKINDLKYVHRILNWTLAIDIMKEEWNKIGFDTDHLFNVPSLDLLNKINHRILSRICIDKEKISYHTWPNFDIQIRNSTRNQSVVFWFPIGFGMNYLYNTVQSSLAPTSQRNKLWTWLGSIKLNERNEMINRFQLNDTLAHSIRQRGYLHIIDTNTPGLVYMDYTALLLDSQFVPLPRGYSPEQYRCFEAIQSGAIPIVNRQWLQINKHFQLEPLAYLNILGYDPPTLTNFENLPETLLELSRLPSQLLDDWQSIMLIRHKIIMKTLIKHIGTVVCATTKSNGYIHQL